ncbi:hypothetical protein GDO86_017046 [Hymenochirus boettgeri]|uniref:MAP2/Tau projection domain-containing protein n=1 Tax=Hymenochirus boettgeri TaxID=247094 RepID=A0A8T2ILH1_9PIPI|nr:hypothetical protein GDO86_017046 [Hymenochirus boettgeri]
MTEPDNANLESSVAEHATEIVIDENDTEESKISEIDLKEKGAKPDLVHQEAVDKEESYESSGEPEQSQEPADMLTKGESLEEAKAQKEKIIPEASTEGLQQEDANKGQSENISEALAEQNIEISVEMEIASEGVAEQADEQSVKEKQEVDILEDNTALSTEIPDHETKSLVPVIEPDVCSSGDITGVNESVVTVEEDFIKVVQTTVDDSDYMTHSVRFETSLPAEDEDTPEVVEEEYNSKDEPREGSPCAPASPQKEEMLFTENRTETQDDYRDETTIDDSILDTDSIWVDTQAVLKKAEIAKKADVQPHSPSRKIILKPAVRQSRPAHQSCVRRKLAGGESPHKQSHTASRQSKDRVLDGVSKSPEKRSSLPRPSSIHPIRKVYPAEKEDNSISTSTSVSSSVRRTTKSEPIWSRTGKSGTTTPNTPGSTAITPGTPPSYASRTPGTPGTPSYSRTPRTPGTPKSAIYMSSEKKVAVLRTPPKSPGTPKQMRVMNQPLPDLKHIRSKIGSTENMKYQPRGGQVSAI